MIDSTVNQSNKDVQRLKILLKINGLITPQHHTTSPIISKVKEEKTNNRNMIALRSVTMETVTRVGVSLEPSLLKKFDILIRKKGYTNRSEAIRDLVRRSILESEIKDDKSEVIGTISIIYDHDVGDVTNKLLHLQHHHHTEISSTTHLHVDEHLCLEVLVVNGKAKDVRELADKIKAIKGVKHGELVVTSRRIR